MKTEKECHDEIRELASRHNLSYYFNPGGVEFFSCAHESIPSCQLCEVPDEEDIERLLKWVEDNKTELSSPEPENYVLYGDGEQGRVIDGKKFVPCTLTMMHEPIGGGDPKEYVYEIVDIEKIDGGWLLKGDVPLRITGSREEMESWEKALFRR